ncbi:MAG: ATP-binding cassette domain-containing protein [Reyranella sp.]|uniref:ABC transporter ATP-binding protein n=1 Tax=Reyranella sp. TaxID=1929291 RepID=UPI001221EAE8|nr:oligopeptide/dipeptide ABC transporter ATP-binding protein [Reyranella sp.]TAJ85068.1 MAG: ATP-binding cassette domain-containing protein [Reyranella sp.]TBR30505.1 MAG: ATP-binding cassette domain-containing protein [Reyranella sp.]
MSAPLVSVRDLKVHFARPNLNPLKPRETVRAVDGVSFDVEKGTTLGIVGESGSGKTTVARGLLRLVPVTSGRIAIGGTDVTALGGEEMRRMRRRMQYVFQDPYSSLNPRVRAGAIVRSPLDVLGIGTPAEREARVAELFAAVGLRPESQGLFPHQFSGGQRQRINIARALAPAPDLLVCDEPVSALDVAIRAQILNLLQQLKRRLGITYVFISHDMAVVKHVADEVAVMYLGQIVERAPRTAFFARPLHPYSVALMSAVPTVRGGRERANRRIRLTGDPPSPIDPPPGCRFAARCPAAEPACRQTMPELRELVPGQWVRCHRVEVVGEVIRRPLG